jgi:hypothetical protein
MARSIAYPVSISEQESNASKAGRFVRAAGVGLRASARELGKTMEETRDRQQVEAAAAAAAAPPPPPPPEPHRVGGPVGIVVFYGFLASVVAFLLVVLRVEMVLSGEVRTGFRIVMAAVLFLEAYLLLASPRSANQRLGQRLLNRVWGPRAAVTRRERGFARAIRDGLTLVGIAWLAAGVFELLAVAGVA